MNDLEKNLSPKPQPIKPSLWEEIKRGWEWVIFVKTMLPRVGGLGEWIQTFYFIFSLMIKRLLTQWKIIQSKR